MGARNGEGMLEIPTSMIADTMMAAIMGLHDEQDARLLTHPKYGKLAVINAKNKQLLVEKLIQIENDDGSAMQHALGSITEINKKLQEINKTLTDPEQNKVVGSNPTTALSNENLSKDQINSRNELSQEYYSLTEELREIKKDSLGWGKKNLKKEAIKECNQNIADEKNKYTDELEQNRAKAKDNLEKAALIEAYRLSLKDEGKNPEADNDDALYQEAEQYKIELKSNENSEPDNNEKEKSASSSSSAPRPDPNVIKDKLKKLEKYSANYLTQVFVDYYDKVADYDKTFTSLDNEIKEENIDGALKVSLKNIRAEKLKALKEKNKEFYGENREQCKDHDDKDDAHYKKNNSLEAKLATINNTTNTTKDESGNSGQGVASSTKLTPMTSGLEVEQLYAHAIELNRENAEYFNHLDCINKREREELGRKLNQIGIETIYKIKENEKAEKIIWRGRYTQSHPFAAFCGTTFAGSFILIGLDYAIKEEKIINDDGKEEILRHIDYDMLTGFALGAVPIFFVVWMANYYITKNLSGKLLYDFFIKGEWKPKNAQEWVSFICSLFATWVSCIFTYFTTYTFLEELTNALNDYRELDDWVIGLFIGVGALSAVFTFITYFAVMHLYGQEISRKEIKNDLKEIGDLALISDIPWVKAFLTRAIIKMTMSLVLIFVMNNPLGFILLGISSLYLVLTAFNYMLSKSDRRTAAQLQVILLTVYCIISMAFLMYAAVDILEMIYGKSDAAEYFGYVTMLLSWIGVIAFYTVSTLKSVLHAMQSTTEKTLKEADPNNELKALTQKNRSNDNDKMADGKKDKDQNPEGKSLAEDYVFLMIAGNGLSNGLGNFYGALEFAREYEFAAAETYALAVSAFLYSSTVSMASNYKGIQADDTRAGEIARLKRRLGTINNAQQFVQSIDAALEEINGYRNTANLSNKDYDYLSYKQWAFGLDRNAQNAALAKVEQLLQEYKNLSTEMNLKAAQEAKGLNYDLNKIEKIRKDITAIGGSINPQDIAALKQGYLGAIYEACLCPFVEIVRAKETLIEHKNHLTKLIERVESYATGRNSRYEYTFGKYFGSSIKFVPGISKTRKVNSANKLIRKLKKALNYIDKVTIENKKSLPNPRGMNSSLNTDSANLNEKDITDTSTDINKEVTSIISTNNNLDDNVQSTSTNVGKMRVSFAAAGTNNDITLDPNDDTDNPFTSDEEEALVDSDLGVLYNESHKYLAFSLLGSNRIMPSDRKKSVANLYKTDFLHNS